MSGDQAARGEWIAGGRIGRDPGDAADTHALNNKIGGMQDELAAAKATLPAKEQVHRDAVSRLQAAQAERASAVAEVAAEICADLASELTRHLNTALSVEARIRSVLEALTGTGPAAERIATIIRKAREEAGVPRDDESGRRLLDALCNDPGAKP
jgi:hypothetical protein